MSEEKDKNVDWGYIPIDINGEEIKVKLQRCEDAENVKGFYPTYYLATARYEDEYFTAEHSEKEKAVTAIEIQIKRYIKEKE